MISATLPRQPGIIKACGRLLPWPNPLSACHARPFRFGGGPGLLGTPGRTSPPFQPGNSSRRHGGGREGGGSPLECRPHLEPHSTEAYAYARPSCRCVFMRKGPDAMRWPQWPCPALHSEVGVKPAVGAGRRWVRRALVVQKRRAGCAEVVGMGDASQDFESPETSHAPCRGRGELKATGGLLVVTQH